MTLPNQGLPQALLGAGLPRMSRVRKVYRENYRTKTIELEASVAGEPGQFAMLWLPGLDEKPFSIRDIDPLAFTIASVGPFSRAVHALEKGDRIWFRGPYGRPFRLEGNDHLLVGGGYGVAPMLFLARQALSRHDRVRAVVGARNAADLLLVDALREAGVETFETTEDGSVGTKGRVTKVIEPMLSGDRPDTLYACGPHGMLDALAGACASAAVPVPAQLSWEAYMRCGVGICGSCEHEGLLLCADGPVLRNQVPVRE
jgi:dihydroorotate dehydrogenase electron transfer subunit